MSNDPRIALYAKLSEHTAPECATQCRRPHSCCDALFCHGAISWARETWGVELKPTGHATLPLMGPDGCVAAPHLRPLCTYHVCSVNALGYKPNDPAWTAKYFDLRIAVQNAEFDALGTHADAELIAARKADTRNGMIGARSGRVQPTPRKCEELALGVDIATRSRDPKVIESVTEQLREIEYLRTRVKGGE